MFTGTDGFIWLNLAVGDPHLGQITAVWTRGLPHCEQKLFEREFVKVSLSKFVEVSIVIVASWKQPPSSLSWFTSCLKLELSGHVAINSPVTGRYLSRTGLLVYLIPGHLPENVSPYWHTKNIAN